MYETIDENEKNPLIEQSPSAVDNILSNINNNRVKQAKGYLRYTNAKNNEQEYYQNKKIIQTSLFEKLGIDSTHPMFRQGGQIWGDPFDPIAKSIVIHRHMTL